MFTKTKQASDHFVKTGHELFTASLTAPGSMGMKKESRVSGLFSKQCDKHLYGGASASRTKVALPPCTKERLCGLQKQEAKSRDRFANCHQHFFKWQSAEPQESPLDLVSQVLHAAGV